MISLLHPRLRYTIGAAAWNGTGALFRGAPLTGVSDGKIFTFCTWFRIDGSAPDDGTLMYIKSGQVGSVNRGGPLVYRDTLNKIVIGALDAAGGGALSVTTSTSFTSGGTWKCLLSSFDMADTGKRHLYIGDTNELNVTTYVDTSLDLTPTVFDNVGVGINIGPSYYLKGAFANMIYWPGSYLDFSQQANRRLFFSSAGKPVNPYAPSGAIATLGTPALFLTESRGYTGTTSGAANGYGKNRGSGGDYTVAYDTGPTVTASPSDD